jgi:hypothetical protein
MFQKFGKGIVPTSLVDAVRQVTESKDETQVNESGWDKEQTPTGTKVYGSNYGNSKKARKDQTKSAVDDLKEPKKKDLEEEKDDDNITKSEVKTIADKEAKKEVKGHEKRMHAKESFTGRLLTSLQEAKEVEKEINEVLKKDASAGDWIHDFVHSDNPKFAGKSKAMRKKMALAAYYAKQNEAYENSKDDKEDDKEEAKKAGMSLAKWEKTAKDKKEDKEDKKEVEEELKGKQYKLDKNKNGKLDSDDFKKLRNEEEQIAERDEGKPGKMFAKIAAKAAKEYGSKEAGNRVAGAIRKKVLAKEEELDEGRMKDIATNRAEDNRLSVPKKNIDVADKSWLKDAGKKPGPLHNVGKGFKAFIQGKKEPMESVELEGEVMDENVATSGVVKPKDKTVDTLAGRVKAPANYDNEHKSYKVKLAQEETEEKESYGSNDPKETRSKKSIATKGALPQKVDNLDPKHGKPNSFDVHTEAKDPETSDAFGGQANFVTDDQTSSDTPKKKVLEASNTQTSSSWKKETPWMKSKGNITDKSGAVHTPMSRAKDLARTAMKKLKQQYVAK